LWRDNTLLQIGFFSAFRRNELMAMEWGHVNFVSEGVEILIPRSKTDQAGEGVICPIPYGHAELCPVAALHLWREKSTNLTGFVFSPITKSGTLSTHALSTNSVNIILKQHARACDLPQALAYSGP
jgi:integrase